MKNTHLKNGLAFMKMHGLGNDFVIVDSRGHDPVMTKSLAIAIADRRRGVGFDQLAEIRPSDAADIDLDFWNADGSRAGACGNATRCVAQFIMAESGSQEITVRTQRGILTAKRAENGEVSVNMGLPQTSWQDIPLSEDIDTEHLPIMGDPIGVGMGNPHCVFFVDDVAGIDVATHGAAIEHHPLFPQSTNVEFAEVRSRTDIRMRVWERGAGITLACGSGACATAVGAHLRGLTERCVRIEVDGGWLTLDWRKDGVWLTGPTAHLYDATFTPEFLGSV